MILCCCLFEISVGCGVIISSRCHDSPSIILSPQSLFSLTIYHIYTRKLTREIKRKFKDPQHPHSTHNKRLISVGDRESTSVNLWCNRLICKIKNLSLQFVLYSVIVKMAKCPVFVKDIWRSKATTTAREESCCFIKQHLPASLIPRQITLRQQHFSSGWV